MNCRLVQLRPPLPTKLDKSTIKSSHNPKTEDAETITLRIIICIDGNIYTATVAIYCRVTQVGDTAVHFAFDLLFFNVINE